MAIPTQSTDAGQTFSEEQPAYPARSGNLAIRLAASENEIIAAQSLR